MPTNVVKTQKDEEKWQKAKKIAAKQGHQNDYGYIMSIYKKMNPDYEFKNENKLLDFIHLFLDETNK